MDPEFKIPPELLERMRRDAEMRGRTNDELVQYLWQDAEEGQTKLHFVLDSRIIWKTQTPQWQDVLLGQLSPDNCDPPGSGPQRMFPQTQSHFGCRVTVDPLLRADVEHSRQAILEGIRKAQVLADAVSLVSFKSVRLRAAIRREASWSDSNPIDRAVPPEGRTHFLFSYETDEERTSANITDDWIRTQLRAFVAVLTGIPDNDVRWTLERAISWHAQANSLEGLGRYIHYWASIELLGGFFYEYLEPAHIGRPSNSDLEATVLRKLLDLSSKNYRDVVNECDRVLNPTAREKILALSKVVLPPDSDIRRMLFDKPRGEKGRPLEGARSMYDIRNDIAHGNTSALFREYLDQNAERLERFQRVSFKFIVAVLNNARQLCQHRSSGFQSSITSKGD